MARSRSRSNSPSRSRSGSPRRNQRSASRDEQRRSRSHSRSRSPVRRSHRRSRSRSPRRSSHYSRYGGGGRRGGAWSGNRNRDNPEPSRCVGIFNLSLYTTENDLRDMFGKFGEIEKVELVYDHPTGRSRGFGFVYFELVDDAKAAREEMNGGELDGHKIRVDFSITKRAHTPTPGQYMGGGRGGRRGGDYRGRRDSYARDSYRRRSPSPRYRRSPSPRYDRDRRSRSGSY